MTGVVSASSRLDAEFTTVCQDKGAASQDHGKVVSCRPRRLGWCYAKGDLNAGDAMDLYVKTCTPRIYPP